MNWDRFRKGQEVRVRAMGGWMRAHVAEVYEDSVSVVLVRGGMEKVTRVFDQRNITSWTPSNLTAELTSADQQSLDW